MATITNYTDYFKSEVDVYCSNVSGCNVSISFTVAPGETVSYLFPNTRDPVNLTQVVPFNAIKQSMDLRKMLNRSPPALKLLTEEEFNNYYVRQATKHGTTVDQALDAAEKRRTAIQNHQPLPDAVTPSKLNEVIEDDRTTRPLAPAYEADVINPRVLNLCLQCHPSIPDSQKITAVQFLTELDTIENMTLDDWSYVQAQGGYYKSVKNMAKKMVAQFASVPSDDEPVQNTQKKVVKVSKKAQKVPEVLVPTQE